jgi:hypothetical protein
LRSRGAAVKVARVARIDWARNAAGLLLPEYWKGTLEPRPTVDWYLGRIDEALEALNNEISRASSPTSSAGNDSNNSSSDSSPPPLPPLTLLAHSAGGWLGRVWMLSEDERTGEEKAALVSDFVCVCFFDKILFFFSGLFVKKLTHSLSFPFSLSLSLPTHKHPQQRRLPSQAPASRLLHP